MKIRPLCTETEAFLGAVHTKICRRQHRQRRHKGLGTGKPPQYHRKPAATITSGDIYGQTLREMALSAAGLLWFGLGLHLGPECELLRDKAVSILKRLRSNGPTTTSELLKNFHLKKQERDPLLQRLGFRLICGALEGLRHTRQR